MNRRKPKQYVCLSQAPIFSGKENEEIIEDIKNFSLYENITSKYSKDDQVRLFSVKRKGIMFIRNYGLFQPRNTRLLQHVSVEKSN
jgi:hypothetical protein